MKPYVPKYLIRTDDESDWLFSLKDRDCGETVNQFTFPVGPYEKNECSDTIYEAGTEVPYHAHEKGVETFIIQKGSVDVTIRGKHTIAYAGDIIHLMPHVAHGFIFLEEGTVWREIFQEINMSAGIMNKNRIKWNYGDLYSEPAFNARYRAANKGLQRVPPVCEEVTREELPELRTPEFGFSIYKFDGVELRQKVGRWETHGVKEVWQAFLNKGVKIEWNDPYCEPEIYYINKGKILFKVMGEEFIAEGNSCVSIPPYTKRTMEVLEDAEILDAGCSIRLLDLIEDYTATEASEPEKLASAEERKLFMQKYGCFVTGFSR